jgi:hypothetical protein
MPQIEYVSPNYAYNFKISIGNYWETEAIADIQTNQFGKGHISIKHQEIPINLAGKGQSKARKKAIRIAKWWINQETNISNNKRLNKYVPSQKRETQRKRKKLRNASRRHHASSDYYRTTPSSLFGMDYSSPPW